MENKVFQVSKSEILKTFGFRTIENLRFSMPENYVFSATILKKIEVHNMQKIGSALVLIVLGLIIIAFPLLGVVPFSILTGLAILFLGVGLLAVGISSMGKNKGWGIAALVLGILAIILGLGFIFNPALFSFAAAIFVFIAGIFLILAGIAAIASRIEGGLYGGVISLVLGIIYIIVAIYIKDPLYLGILIGLWLLITGIMTLFQD